MKWLFASCPAERKEEAVGRQEQEDYTVGRSSGFAESTRRQTYSGVAV